MHLTRDVELVDFDFDGFLDILEGGDNSEFLVYKNNGNRSFSLESNTQILGGNTIVDFAPIDVFQEGNPAIYFGIMTPTFTFTHDRLYRNTLDPVGVSIFSPSSSFVPKGTTTDDFPLEVSVSFEDELVSGLNQNDIEVENGVIDNYQQGFKITNSFVSFVTSLVHDINDDTLAFFLSDQLLKVRLGNNFNTVLTLSGPNTPNAADMDAGPNGELLIGDDANNLLHYYQLTNGTYNLVKTISTNAVVPSVVAIGADGTLFYGNTVGTSRVVGIDPITEAQVYSVSFSPTNPVVDIAAANDDDIFILSGPFGGAYNIIYGNITNNGSEILSVPTSSSWEGMEVNGSTVYLANSDKLIGEFHYDSPVTPSSNLTAGDTYDLRQSEGGNSSDDFVSMHLSEDGSLWVMGSQLLTHMHQGFHFDILPEDNGLVKVSLQEAQVFRQDGLGNASADLSIEYFNPVPKLSLEFAQQYTDTEDTYEVNVLISESTDFDENKLSVTNGFVSGLNAGPTTELATVGTYGTGLLDYESAWDIVQAPYNATGGFGGSILVADRQGNKIMVYLGDLSQQSVPFTSFGNGNFNTPSGVHNDGNFTFVADQENHRVVIYDGTTETASQIGVTGTSGGGTTLFNKPVGVTTDEIGNLYVADQNNNRVQIFSRSGSVFTYTGTISSGINQPQDVAVIEDEDLIMVSSYGNNRVMAFDRSTRSFIRNTSVNAPRKISVDSFGRIYATTQSVGQVFVLDSKLNHLDTLYENSGLQLTGVAIGQRNEVFTTSHSATNSTVKVFTTAFGYRVEVQGTKEGTVEIQVPQGNVKDIAGIGNPVSNVLSQNFIDNTPEIFITSNHTISPVATPIVIEFNTSEVMTGFTGTDVVVTNGVLDNFGGSGTTYTGTVTPIGTGNFDVTIDIAAAVAQDADNNDNGAAQLVFAATDIMSIQRNIINPVQCHGGAGMTSYSTSGGVPLAPSGSLDLYEYEVTGMGFPTVPIATRDNTFTLQGGESYTIKIRDGVGNELTETFIMPHPDQLAFTTSVVDVSCNGISDGVLAITATGGTTPYEYTIDAGSTFQSSTDFNGLAAGTYEVGVRDGNGCVTSAYTSVSIDEPSALLPPVVGTSNYATTYGTSIVGGWDIAIDPSDKVSTHFYLDNIDGQGLTLDGVEINSAVTIGAEDLNSLSYSPNSVGSVSFDLQTTLSSDAECTSGSAEKVTVSTNRAPLSVSASSYNIKFGEALPTFSGTFEGVVNGDDITVSFVSMGDGSSAGTFEIVGSITDPDGRLDNYTVTNTSGSLIVDPAEALIVLTNLNQEEDGTAKEPTITTDPSDLSFTLEFEGLSEAPSAVGSYPFTVTIDETNYKGTAMETLIITEREEEVLSLGMSETQVQVYPNPTASEVTVISKDASEIHIISLQGALVHRRGLNQQSVIDVSRYERGIYIMHLLDEGTLVAIRRLIVR